VATGATTWASTHDEPSYPKNQNQLRAAGITCSILRSEFV
jgi:hypothetical protein